MAAEKLTKQRLIQIVFMLAILSIAFVWRTVTYTEVKTVECKGEQQCSVTVSSQKLTITRTALGTYEISPVPHQWQISSDMGTLSDLGEGKWKFSIDVSQMEQKPTILINGKVNIKVINTIQ